MIVKFRSDYSLKSNGFLAVACCAVTVTSNECEYKYINDHKTKQIVVKLMEREHFTETFSRRLANAVVAY